MSALDRLKAGLARTRGALNTPVEDLVRGRRPLDAAALDAVEEALLAADLGPASGGGGDGDAAGPERRRSRPGERPRCARPSASRSEAPSTGPRAPRPFSSRPWVVFVVGVNGAGKTTTIGKLAQAWKRDGETLVCAADTFRAAAAEQLEVWAERRGRRFHRGAEGADPSAVLTDALRMARARGHDAVLVDTAGRLHTKGNLMAELAKMARVAGKEVAGAPHETLLVLDATMGGNGLAQAREFTKAAGVTGLVLTKLDGTAKGGVAVAVVRELGCPSATWASARPPTICCPSTPRPSPKSLVG